MMSSGEDPHHLRRFVRAQKGVYEEALAELRAGQKRSHWMWFIFPQFDGLGRSERAKKFAIKSVAEAEAYLRHPVLGPRLTEACEVTAAVEGRTVEEIFAFPDNLKLQSCATLFDALSPQCSPFQRVLEKYFAGRRDEETLGRMKDSAG